MREGEGGRWEGGGKEGETEEEKEGRREGRTGGRKVMCIFPSGSMSLERHSVKSLQIYNMNRTTLYFHLNHILYMSACF